MGRIISIKTDQVHRGASFIPVPLLFVQDAHGDLHFGTDEPPLRTLVDIYNLPFGKWLKLDATRGQVIIALDNRRVVYQCIGVDLHGHWICDLAQ